MGDPPFHGSSQEPQQEALGGQGCWKLPLQPGPGQAPGDHEKERVCASERALGLTGLHVEPGPAEAWRVPEHVEVDVCPVHSEAEMSHFAVRAGTGGQLPA